MRLGELLALRWSDVDLKGEMVTVTRTVTRSRTGGAIRKSGVRRTTFHQLRHTNATPLGEILPPRLLQDRLGLATLAMTMRYSHVTANMARGAARQVEALLIEADGESRDKLGTTSPEEEENLA
jgi:integrase